MTQPQYKIIIKPLKSIKEMPRMSRGKEYLIDDENVVVLDMHLYHIQFLPLSYCIAVYDKSQKQVLEDFEAAGRDMNNDWLMVLDVKRKL